MIESSPDAPASEMSEVREQVPERQGVEQSHSTDGRIHPGGRDRRCQEDRAVILTDERMLRMIEAWNGWPVGRAHISQLSDSFYMRLREVLYLALRWQAEEHAHRLAQLRMEYKHAIHLLAVAEIVPGETEKCGYCSSCESGDDCETLSILSGADLQHDGRSVLFDVNVGEEYMGMSDGTAETIQAMARVLSVMTAETLAKAPVAR